MFRDIFLKNVIHLVYVYLQYTYFNSNRSLAFTPSVFGEHSLIIMDYSACSLITVCRYCSIFCDSSSSHFHSCNLLLTNAVSVPHSICFQYFLESLSCSPPLLHVYPSLFVSNIICPDTLWCSSCLLHFSSSLLGLVLQLPLFQAADTET